MDVGSAFPADAKAAEAVQPGEGALDHPPVSIKPGAVSGATSGDGGHDAAIADLVAVDVVVVAAVGEERVALTAGSADSAADGRDRIEQRDQPGDVVAVAAGQQDRERGAVPVGDQMALRAGPAPVDRRRPRVLPPFNALTWEESTTQRDPSSREAALNPASRTSCSRCQTPASFQSRNRHQHVMPDPNPNSCGRYSHRNLRSRFGSNSSRRSHSSSGTIHGDVPASSRTLNSRPEHGHQDRSTSLC